MWVGCFTSEYIRVCICNHECVFANQKGVFDNSVSPLPFRLLDISHRCCQISIPCINIDFSSSSKNYITREYQWKSRGKLQNTAKRCNKAQSKQAYTANAAKKRKTTHAEFSKVKLTRLWRMRTFVPVCVFFFVYRLAERDGHTWWPRRDGRCASASEANTVRALCVISEFQAKHSDVRPNRIDFLCASPQRSSP